MILVLSLLIFLFPITLTQGKWIDLTYALNKNVPVWPGRKVTFNTEYEDDLPGGGWLASKGFCISEHTATHMDTPYHYFNSGFTLSDLSLDNMLDVPGVVIDVYDKVHIVTDGKVNIVPNYEVTREDLLEWEQANGQIPEGALVLIRTGWGSRWNSVDDYQGIPTELRTTTTTLKPGVVDNSAPSFDLDAAKRLNFPGFHLSAATFLTTERNMVGAGIDTFSIDPGFTRFRLWAVPFKIDSGTGSPTRLLAKLDD